MKNQLKVVVFFLMTVVSSACYGQNKPDTVTIKTRIKCDHCKACETYGMKFERDLYFGKGIKRSKYNSTDTTITVIYRTTKTNLDIIREKIARLGYDADNVPADPKAYRKLDNCCKKE